MPGGVDDRAVTDAHPVSSICYTRKAWFCLSGRYNEDRKATSNASFTGFPAFPLLKLYEPALQETLTKLLVRVHKIGGEKLTKPREEHWHLQLVMPGPDMLF